MQLTSHEWFLIGVGGLWVYSAAVSALPTPTTASSAFYTWFYTFSKTIAGDLGSAFNKYLPTPAQSAQKGQ
jgi:hypothetical protein